MIRRTGARTALGTASALLLASLHAGAHKPITSRYTYNEHVYPILSRHCGSCHVEGGVAPMSLMTYADAVPWAESIRAELVAAHMPPRPTGGGAIALDQQPALTPRELDILLTWATGGTPEGPASIKVTSAGQPSNWPLGIPDLVIDLPEPVTLPPGVMETTRAFVIGAPRLNGRHVRAIDLLPGTAAVVRRGSVVARSKSPSVEATARDRLLSLWLPGGDTIAAPKGTGFAVPDDADLVVTVVYRKTWRYENVQMTDRSRVGVYFADGRVGEIDGVALDREPKTLTGDVSAVAIRVDATQPDREVDVDAVLPDGSRLRLLAEPGLPEWPRRFWFERPLPLPRGTRVELTNDAAGPTVVLDVVRRP